MVRTLTLLSELRFLDSVLEAVHRVAERSITRSLDPEAASLLAREGIELRGVSRSLDPPPSLFFS